MKSSQRQSSGQIVIEYILLLIIAVGLALIITSSLVNRDPNNPGLLISKWYKIINFIGEDKIEE